MKLQLHFAVSNTIYVKDPESSELGKQIVYQGILLMNRLGFEQFTFKKLAQEMETTEASIYRYFENKHCLLLYILNWYWSFLHYLLNIHLSYSDDVKLQLQYIVKLLTDIPQQKGIDTHMPLDALYNIVIHESNKTYLTQNIDKINKAHMFKPYKELCSLIAGVIKKVQPKYPYPLSLSSTILEMSHLQYYFCNHLPRLTDIKSQTPIEYTRKYLLHMLSSTLSIKWSDKY